MAKNKYYILKWLSPNLLNDYLCEFDKEKRVKIEKKLDTKLPLLLIEKTSNKYGETYTNIFTIMEGDEFYIQRHTRGAKVWDYTGAVYPLIHVEGQILTYKKYCENIIDKRK